MLPLRLVFTVVLLFPALQDVSPEFIRWSTEDLARRDVALSTRMRPDHSARETLAEYGNPSGAHRFRFIRRDADGIPERHAGIEDVAFIQSGAGTIVVGGNMIGQTGSNGEYTGTDIQGGTRYSVSAGDVIHIPADIPHRYLVPEGGHVTYVLVRMPVLNDPVVPDDAPVLNFDPPGFALWRNVELQQRHNALTGQIGPDHSARETLADYGSSTRSHRFRYIHRNADGLPEIHDDIIDVVFIKSGAGRLLVGGEILNRRGSLGSGIDGGATYPVAAGDVLHIPAKTPHGYLVEDGEHITYVLVRLPAFLP